MTTFKAQLLPKNPGRHTPQKITVEASNIRNAQALLESQYGSNYRVVSVGIDSDSLSHSFHRKPMPSTEVRKVGYGHDDGARAAGAGLALLFIGVFKGGAWLLRKFRDYMNNGGPAPPPVASEAKPAETEPTVDNKSMSFILIGGVIVFIACIIYGIASSSPPSPTTAQIQANAIAEFKREHPKPQFTGTGDIMPENSLANPESPIQLYSRENRNSPLVRHDQHDDLPEWARPRH